MFDIGNVSKLFLMWDVLQKIMILFCCRVFYIRHCSYFVVGCLTLGNVTIFYCISVKDASLGFPILHPISLPCLIHVAPNSSQPSSIVVGLLAALLPMSALGLCVIGMEPLTFTSTIVSIMSSDVSSVTVVVTNVSISVPHRPFHLCIHFCLLSERHVSVIHCYHPFDIKLEPTNCCYYSDRLSISLWCSYASNCVLFSHNMYIISELTIATMSGTILGGGHVILGILSSTPPYSRT